MTIEDRKDREKLRMKELILQAAEQIITEEGFEKLSVRKIANRIEYSPGIIYHYFNNKNDIISQILCQGHQNLISALSEHQPPSATPEIRLKNLSRSYIETALKDPDRFLAVQLNKAPDIQKFTAYLFPGAATKKPALQILSSAIREISDSNASEQEIEWKAQIIAACTLGLITKIILETDIEGQQKEALINCFTETVVNMAK